MAQTMLPPDLQKAFITFDTRQREIAASRLAMFPQTRGYESTVLDELTRRRSTQQPAKPPACRDLTPTVALEEATAIARAAADAVIEIDWSREPLTDRERDLRLAVIRRVEMENAAKGPGVVLGALQNLVTFDDEEYIEDDESGCIASDLSNAADRWSAAWFEDCEREQQAARARLLDAARRDLESPKEDA
jgi:hypothetical protein